MLKTFGLHTTVEETAKILMRTVASSSPFIYFWYLQQNAYERSVQETKKSAAYYAYCILQYRYVNEVQLLEIGTNKKRDGTSVSLGH
jgi:hypothetical protein